MKKLAISATVILLVVIASPMLMYWWGLSNLETKPAPSSKNLTPSEINTIWAKEHSQGTPEISPVTVYGYVEYVICEADRSNSTKECNAKYPGLRFAALAVRKQVAEQLQKKGNGTWQITWIAYTVWVSQNWSIEQILATYDDVYSET